MRPIRLTTPDGPWWNRCRRADGTARPATGSTSENTVYGYFGRWERDGILEHLNALPAELDRSLGSFMVLLTAGRMLVVPAARAWLPDLVEDRRLGFFTGALSALSGAVVLAGGAPVGALLERGGALPWLVLAAVPLVGPAAVPRRW
ncbi:hypothetical protein [Streptomyces sp. NPDC003032]